MRLGYGFRLGYRIVQATPELTETTDAEKELIRQGERTVDNLKRLFAFIFAISFGVIGIGAIEKLKPILTDPAAPARPLLTWIINIEMLALFVITAGVFYHQGAKFLDTRYARHPLSEAHPYGFAWDYLTLIVTMVPFFFMAHSFHPSVTNEVGYIWFFGFYVVLLLAGLLLLISAQFRHSSFVRTKVFNERIAPTEISREGALRTYWFLMNSFVLLLMLLLFGFFVWLGAPCPTSVQGGFGPYFLFLFGILAIARDLLDYRYAWRFLYPVRPDTAEKLDLWPMTRIRDATRQWIWTVPGYVFVGASMMVIYYLRLWDFGYWANACRF